jgi:hypothetical protein
MPGFGAPGRAQPECEEVKSISRAEGSLRLHAMGRHRAVISRLAFARSEFGEAGQAIAFVPTRRAYGDSFGDEGGASALIGERSQCHECTPRITTARARCLARIVHEPAWGECFASLGW